LRISSVKSSAFIPLAFLLGVPKGGVTGVFLLM
jgi:hypothetical protein